MKLGDKVRVLKGGYKGAIGTVVGITYSLGKQIICVEPNEHADDRTFWASELKVITIQEYKKKDAKREF